MSDKQSNERPAATSGLRHVALFVPDLDAALDFYVRLLGMVIEWQPDDDNVYLTSGNDNLALHRRRNWDPSEASAEQRLDHMGFILDTPDQVDAWHEFLQAQGVDIKAAPRTHRDGARSFYCHDPSGVLVQMIYHPPLVTGASQAD
ncbi:MAG: VOC family protein [Pseudomonadales bacterium]|nr:VOC family protein [Pseudomonadales bacterium]